MAMYRAAPIILFASLLAACGGAGVGQTAPPHPVLIASPAAVDVNLLGGGPAPEVVTLGGSPGFANGLHWSATDLSFMSVSLQQPSSPTQSVNLYLVGAGTSSVTVANSAGAFVSIPVTSVPCGRPDIVNYAQLISPASGAQNVSTSTPTYYVEVGGLAGITSSPFTPVLHAHFVATNQQTIDPHDALSPATPPPGASTPAPPPNDNTGVESAAMPALNPGWTYTVYLWDDTCEAPWNAGTFST